MREQGGAGGPGGKEGGWRRGSRGALEEAAGGERGAAAGGRGRSARGREGSGAVCEGRSWVRAVLKTERGPVGRGGGIFPERCAFN